MRAATYDLRPWHEAGRDRHPPPHHPMHELFAFLVVSMVVGVTALVLQRRIGGTFGQLLLLGLCLRIVGATLRFEVIERAYGGTSDAKQYFFFGSQYAERMADLDFRFLLGQEEDALQRWWGTQFVRSVSAIVIFFVGENIRAAFLVFSCFSFLGQYLLVDAFGKAYGRDCRADFARWAWFWPSLWFWPSSIGKEALLTLALGLFVTGYVGLRGAPNWRQVLSGLGLAVAIRPHVGMVFALAAGAAELARRRDVGRRGKVLTGLAVVVMAAVSVRVGLSLLGLGDADFEGIEEYFDQHAVNTEQGGSRITRTTGVLAVPMAFVNVFFRPFPWEARGIQAFSSLEIWSFWILAYFRRDAIRAGLRRWRENRFAALGIPLAISLALMYGVAFANLGIIARQRVVVLPFMIALLALPRVARALQPATASRVTAPRQLALNQGRTR